jgi:carboxymethylenebutenolidase
MERNVMPESTYHVNVGTELMEVYSSLPSGDGPFPAMIVIMNAFGLVDFTKAMCDKLAAEGYAAFAPDLFHSISDELAQTKNTTKRELMDDVQIIADVSAAVEFVKNSPEVRSDKLGITGFCCGGRIAWLMAAVSSEFKAVVPYYGGNLFAPWGDGTVPPFDMAIDINCPMLFHFGAEDNNPSQEDMLVLDKKLSELGKDYKFYSYPDAGHAFMDFNDAGRYNQRASDMSWPRTLDFLAEHLKD